MSQQKIGFGMINDTDDSLKSKESGVFGLNTGFIKKIEYNPNAGTDGAAADAVDIEISINDRTYNRRVYDVTRVYHKSEQIDAEHPQYVDTYNKEVKQAMAVIIHAVKAVGVTTTQLQTALAEELPDFASWAQVVIGLVPANYKSKPVDVFLEYQWNISDGQDRTYLEVPRNMKGGYFLCPAQAGPWKPQTEWSDNGEEQTGLRYVNPKGDVHPFDRNASYVESKKAKVQVEGEDSSDGSAIDNADKPASAKSSSW